MEATAIVNQKSIYKSIPIELLKRGQYQPRQHFEATALENLAVTIKRDGIIEPLVVRPFSSDNHSFEIIAGERRWRAAQLAGLQEVPCLVRQYTDEEAARISLVENTQRENLNSIEEAAAIKILIKEFEYTHEIAGAILGKSRTVVTNLLRLLELDERVQDLIREKKLTDMHGRLLAGISKQEQFPLALLAIKHNWSSRALEKAIKEKTNKIKPTVGKDSNTLRLEQDFSSYLGYPAIVQCDSQGRGEVVIKFTNLDQLDGIFDKVGFKTEK